MDKIRNFIIKELNAITADLLLEDYRSIREIELLSNEIFKQIAILNGDRIGKWALHSSKPTIHFYPVVLGDVFRDSTKKAELKNLTALLEKSRNVEIYINIKDGSTRGSYSRPMRHRFQQTDDRTINININGDNLRHLRYSLIDATKDYSEDNGDFDKVVIGRTLGFLRNMGHVTMVHEIQHLYDDFRSNTKIFDTKENISFQELQTKAEQLDKEFKEAFLGSAEVHLKYLNLPHEVWARFTQFVIQVNFTTSDAVKNDDGQIYFKEYMRPLGDVIKDFKIYYRGEEHLTPEMRKRLIRKVSQFWHKEQERIKISNLRNETFK